METTTWSEGDLGTITAILNAAQPFDRFGEAQVREGVFGDPDYSPDLLRCARVDGRIVGFAAGVRRRPHGPATTPTGFVKALAVAPGSRGRGLGKMLLDDLEERLRDLGVPTVRVFSDAPMYLRPGVDFRSTELICLLLRRGYAFRRNAVNMDVALARAPLDTRDDERRLAAEDFEVRRLARADEDAIAAYMATNWSWSWGVEVRQTFRRNPISTHLAWRDGEIIGFASAAVMGPNHFGPMGVNADLRRHGLGGVLLKRCLADLRDRGEKTADIQWVGPIGFYSRQVGAILSRCFWHMEKEF